VLYVAQTKRRNKNGNRRKNQIYPQSADMTQKQLGIEAGLLEKTADTRIAQLDAWREKAQMWRNGEITKDKYDNWRYSFSEIDTTDE